MSGPDEIRRRVSESYTRAVTQSRSKGCCSGASEPVEQKGVVVKFGGYRREELEALPADAVTNSFGCGNPVAFSELMPGQTVLDLGSGAGLDLFLAADKVGPTGKVIGVDMTDAMIERARANATSGGYRNVEVRKGVIEQLPIDDASIDWVISNCVINLSPDKPRVFAEIARVLKPGGRMLVSDIVASGLPDEVLKDPALYCSCISGAISLEDYLGGLRAAGLIEVLVHDRLTYDAAQLEAFFKSELPEAKSCCSSSLTSDPARLRQVAASMVGRIESVRVHGRKPAA